MLADTRKNAYKIARPIHHCGTIVKIKYMECTVLGA